MILGLQRSCIGSFQELSHRVHLVRILILIGEGAGRRVRVIRFRSASVLRAALIHAMRGDRCRYPPRWKRSLPHANDTIPSQTEKWFDRIRVGFFNLRKGGFNIFAQTVMEMDEFLGSIGYLEGEFDKSLLKKLEPQR